MVTSEIKQMLQVRVKTVTLTFTEYIIHEVWAGGFRFRSLWSRASPSPLVDRSTTALKAIYSTLRASGHQ